MTKKLSKAKHLTGMYTKGQIETAKLFGCEPKNVATSIDELENCEYFCGDLILNALTNADTVYTNNIKGVNGNLIIMNCCLDVVNNLKCVTGYVQIISSKIKYINNLTNIGGNLSFTNSVLIAMPHLKCISGDLLMQNSDILNFNELENIKHTAFLIDSYVGSAKNLKQIEHTCFVENSKIDVLPSHKIFCPSITIIDTKRNITHKYDNYYTPTKDIEKE